MALFGTKKNTKAKADKVETKAVVVTPQTSSFRDLSHIIKSPRITEKASMKVEANIYTFEVAEVATKSSIAAAVREMYNVSPVKVAIVRIPKKDVFVRGKVGTKGGGKKAYIYLKKGETIEFA